MAPPSTEPSSRLIRFGGHPRQAARPCWLRRIRDNALAEPFFAMLKNELIGKHELEKELADYLG